MPPRDENEFEQRRQQIIDGALEVFAAKGYEKATNKDIARAAGVGSPGLIYHYFQDKADLFHQMVVQRIPIVQLLDHPANLMERPPRETLALFAHAFLRILDNPTSVAALKVVFSEAIRRPALAQLINDVGPGRGFQFIAEYCTHQMEVGTFRQMDVGAAVRCFIGPLIAYVGASEIFPQPDAQSLDREVMVTTMVDIFLSGMEVGTRK